MRLVQVPYRPGMGSRRDPAGARVVIDGEARRGRNAGRSTVRRVRGVRQVVLTTLLALLLATSAVRAATQADACDPAGADGCPLAFHSDMRALLKQGTDLHTYRLAIPAAGRFLVTASP